MEVFARRVPTSPSGRGVEKAYPLLAPEQVQALFQRRVIEICSRFDEWKTPIRVGGVIGDVPGDHWRRREGTPLLDAQTGASLLLDIPPSLLAGEGVRAGEKVQVVGWLKAQLQKGHITLRCEVLSIEQDVVETATQRSEALLEIMRSLLPRRRAFPVQEGARMLLLGIGIEGERLRRMQPTLGGLWTDRTVVRCAVPKVEAEAFLQTLPQVEQDIILLIVAEDCLAVLENAVCLKALLSCPAYRILAYDGGASNSEQATLLPHMVEQFFMTPLEAAEFIRQHSAQVRQRQDEERAQQEELAALRTSLAALTQRPTDGSSRFSWFTLLCGVTLGTAIVVVGHWGIHIF
ncbi:hypothetical protein [Bombella saccharophila]|uniref:Uncharacterized protein n=1 Tax=Bombella saccharophila TaxID=2967338 RepID=A0ABT3W746_9PROT|nr:hypothetical protein [Bombella saccharophila]MCX5614901.1 hypothetical protein [Bombella saccharophila]PHI96384.1 hypothetical protein BG621_05440 [Parasaccharibacter apium]